MREEHEAVKVWSERVQDGGDRNAYSVVVERAGWGWRRLTARRVGQARDTFYVAHYIRCRCGKLFMSRQPATTRSLLRAHQAQWLAEKNARSGFDAAAARRAGHMHGGGDV